MRSTRPTAAVILSAVLLGLLCLAVAANALYVRHGVSELKRQVAALPDVPGEGVEQQLDELEDTFGSMETGLSMSIRYALLDRVREQLASVRAYAAGNNRDEYATAVAGLWEAVRDLDRLERFSARNI